MRSIPLVAVAFLVACTEQHLLNLLQDHLPGSISASLEETCIEFPGPSVALFTLDKNSHELITTEEQKQTTKGVWSRASSLSEFVGLDDDYEGLGVWATIGDGKDCLNEISDDARQILFREKPGNYFHSNNREIVIVIFDEPTDTGVIFVQSP